MRDDASLWREKKVFSFPGKMGSDFNERWWDATMEAQKSHKTRRLILLDYALMQTTQIYVYWKKLFSWTPYWAWTGRVFTCEIKENMIYGSYNLQTIKDYFFQKMKIL